MSEIIEEQLQRLNESLYVYDPQTDQEINIPEALVGLTAGLSRVVAALEALTDAIERKD